jgi:hypothetical protein
MGLKRGGDGAVGLGPALQTGRSRLPFSRSWWPSGILRPLARWDWGFESRREQRCLCCVLYSKDKGTSQDNPYKQVRKKVQKENKRKIPDWVFKIFS